jgi:hypothetical protein
MVEGHSFNFLLGGQELAWQTDTECHEDTRGNRSAIKKPI